MIASLGLLALSLTPAPLQDEERSWVVRAEVVYTASGDPIEDGWVAISDGVIDGVGPGSAGGDDALRCYAVTPGLVDLSVRIVPGRYSVEESSEARPDLPVAQAVDLYSTRWLREARSGVTTALVSPEDDDVLGGLGVAVKTAGPPTLAERTVRANAVVRGSTGRAPSLGSRSNGGPGRKPRDFFARRPTTRMSVEWILRKSLYDALAAREDDSLATPVTAVLDGVLRGDVPLMLQAWATQDVRTVCYLQEEFGIPRLIVDAAAEAWREPELLVRSGVSVVLPPMTFGSTRGTDDSFYMWSTAALLHELGVPFALSGHGNARPDERLAIQPAHAMRGGLPFDAALRSVTLEPARMIGIDDRVGSLEAGKDADLVLWNGEPFVPTSRIVGVLVDGRLVLDPRPDAETD